MSSDESYENRDQFKKVVKKEKRNWMKKTKVVHQRLVSVVSGLFMSKKSDPTSAATDNSDTRSYRSKSRRSLKKISFLTSLFKKGKAKKIQEEEDKENQSSARRMSGRRKVKIASSVRDGSSSSREARFDESEDEDLGNELCKRKILMGGKCKPLELSGVLVNPQSGASFDR